MSRRSDPRVLLLPVLVSLLWALSPAQAGAARKPCPRQVTDRSDVAVLFVRTEAEESHQLVACVKATRRRVVLAGWFAHGSSTDDPAPQSWLSGRFAAVNQAACPSDPFSDAPCTGKLKVVDLRTRRTHTTVTTGSPIFDLFLTRRGSVGMIHRSDVITAVGSDVRVLDRAAEASSLAYAPALGRLYWTSAGQSHFTSLR